jgi:hypothetical protein
VGNVADRLGRRLALSPFNTFDEQAPTLAYSLAELENGISMQDLSNLWEGFTAWLSLQLSLIQTQPDEFGRELMSLLWDMSNWLNRGNKGVTIALIILVLIVNRILKRQH